VAKSVNVGGSHSCSKRPHEHSECGDKPQPRLSLRSSGLRVLLLVEADRGNNATMPSPAYMQVCVPR
jgi:hypothetical protein